MPVVAPDQVIAPARSNDRSSKTARSASLRPSRRGVVHVSATLVLCVVYAMSAQLASSQVVVKPGDTLSRIASDYRVSVQAIAAANGIDDPNVIRAGQSLTIPSATADVVHEVRAGDTLSKIAITYGSTPSAIAERNNVANPDLIRIGQTLVIPRMAATAPPTTAPATTAPATTAPATTAPPTTAPPTTAPPTTAPPTTAPAQSAVAQSATAPPGTVPPGTVPRITVPSGGLVSTMWVVQPGDTITSIAARFSMTPRRLASANALTETDPLLTGQRIYVPQS